VLDALVTEARLRFGLDPAAGLQVVAAERLIATPFEASRPVMLVPLALLRPGDDDPEPVVPLAGRHGPRGRTSLVVLARAYPADHAVGRFGTTDTLTIGALRDEDLALPLYLAPVAPEAAVAGPWAMPAISARLRGPGGCPWDQEQTHASLRKHLLEEAYEVYDALEAGATPALAGELGDLLLQVVLHAQLAAEAGVFDLTDVEAATRMAAAMTAVARASRVDREAQELLRAVLTSIAQVEDTGLDHDAIEALVTDVIERLTADDPVWRLADRIGRLRAADPDDVELAIDWLDVLLARTERRAESGRRRLV